ncbi:flagellar hook-length control protein FliK [Alienimonas chondri]|uniref:Flagellar hook-length control protein-like C-terminal domain-containing protein n=1 Tax=Alienimonas chondri TaxID=2681879 RepID=A0ABX1VHM6_9PLAN|nr:flagellar hook-length control protein FliK [Alienimonas chondri]NNJ26990.1 hypothetical protein [Alienimonas chondri]
MSLPPFATAVGPTASPVSGVTAPSAERLSPGKLQGAGAAPGVSAGNEVAVDPSFAALLAQLSPPPAIEPPPGVALAGGTAAVGSASESLDAVASLIAGLLDPAATPAGAEGDEVVLPAALAGLPGQSIEALPPGPPPPPTQNVTESSASGQLPSLIDGIPLPVGTASPVEAPAGETAFPPTIPGDPQAEPSAIGRAAPQTDQDPTATTVASPLDAAAVTAPATLSQAAAVAPPEGLRGPGGGLASAGSDAGQRRTTARPFPGTSTAANAGGGASPAAPPGLTNPSADALVPVEDANPTVAATAVTPEVASPVTAAPVAAVRRDPNGPSASTIDRLAVSAPSTAESAGVRSTVPSPSANASAEIVADAVSRAIEQNRPIRVRLDPPELGTVRVEVSAASNGDAGAVRIRLSAAEPAARAVLAEALPRLRETLASAGVTVDAVDLDGPTRPERAESGRESGRDADRRDGDSGNRRESGGRGSEERSDGEAEQRRGRGEPSADEPSDPEGTGDGDSAGVGGAGDPAAPVTADADWGRTTAGSSSDGRAPAGSLDIAA